MKLKPQTKFGKWSVGLNAFFLAAVVFSATLVNGFGILSYNDRWWDVTVPVLALASIAASILGIKAARQYKDTSILVRASIVVGLLTILFILLHSLFISD